MSGILALGLSITNELDRSFYTNCLYETALDIENINHDYYTEDPVTGEAGAVRGLGAGVVQVSSDARPPPHVSVATNILCKTYPYTLPPLRGYSRFLGRGIRNVHQAAVPSAYHDPQPKPAPNAL